MRRPSDPITSNEQLVYDVNHLPVGRIHQDNAIVPVDIPITAILRSPLVWDCDQLDVSRQRGADTDVAGDGDRPHFLPDHILADGRAVLRRQLDNGGLRE